MGTEVFERERERRITSIAYIKLHKDLGIYHNQSCYMSLLQFKLLREVSEADPLIADVELGVYVL